jgi:hypothetical protein
MPTPQDIILNLRSRALVRLSEVKDLLRGCVA